MTAGQNIVKLVEKNFFIAIANLFRRIFLTLKETQKRDYFRFSQFPFKSAVEHFEIGLCGECSPVHFKIQFTVPDSKVFIVFQILFKKFASAHMLRFGHYGNLIKTLHHFKHFFRYAAAAVTVAEHLHCFAARNLILICFPVLLNLTGHIPCYKMRGRNTGIDIRSVNSSPDKIVVRKTVCIVPG